MYGWPTEAIGTLTFHAGYATSRISSILNGRTKQFGWLQAGATKVSCLSLGADTFDIVGC